MEQAITVCANKTPYALAEILQLAQRDNNSRRKFLLVNPKQGKHLPVAPQEALTLFDQLGEQLAQSIDGKKAVVIGFAETATAIGAVVARALGAETPYLQTTRETLGVAFPNLLDFEEEHSHAINQCLYCREPRTWLTQAEVVVFVDDEITTGKTILNFVAALQEAGYLTDDQQVVVASIFNGMSADALGFFARQGITCQHLVQIVTDATLDPFPQLVRDPMIQADGGATATVYALPGRLETRAGVLIGAYEDACRTLGQQIITLLAEDGGLTGQTLVLGTEECMYPAILVGHMLEERWPAGVVRTHATTRSPIKPKMTATYPVKAQYGLESLYEAGRQTYVYNLKAYDHVVVVTDALPLNETGLAQLVALLQGVGCQNILTIRWVT